jgi:2-hydroxychromene-2-carboxylate isomerase
MPPVEPHVEFHFDFGSPNAYLAHRVIPSLEQRTGVRFEYVPVLLGGVFKLTNNRSPAETTPNVRNKREYERLELDRFVRRHDIPFQWNPHFPVNTLTLMRGAVAARQLGMFEHYVEEIYRHMWVEPKQLDDPEVLRAVLLDCGFDAEQLLAATTDLQVKQALMTNTARSVERGNFGSPTFFVEDEMFFGKDRLTQVEEAIIARR